jgi:hypothetical protein
MSGLAAFFPGGDVMASSRKLPASARLDAARNELATTEHRIIEVEKARADAILADADDSARELDVRLETLQRDLRIQRDRVGLLEGEAAKEAEEKRRREQAARIGRIEAKKRQQDKALLEACEAIKVLAAASEKAIRLGREIVEAWPWPPHDLPPALLTPSSILTAISHELFRTSYHPHRYGGQDTDPLVGHSLPGSRSPTLQLAQNPAGVREMSAVVADATAFAKKLLWTGKGSADERAVAEGVQHLAVAGGSDSEGVHVAAATVEVPANGQGDEQDFAPAGREVSPVPLSEAEARLAYLLRQQATLAEDVSPQGEEAYARCVAEIVQAQAVVSAEQTVGAQGNVGRSS